MKEGTRLECDNCGKEVEGKFKVVGNFWVHNKKSSWDDYERLYRRFCSRECYEEYKLKEKKELDKLDSLSIKKKLRFLLKKNVFGLFGIFLLLATIMVLIYFLITISDFHDVQSDTLFLGMCLFAIITLIFIIIRIVRHPWIMMDMGWG